MNRFPAPDEGTRKRMQAVQRFNSEPEKVVQVILRTLGYRFTTHARLLPGKPDIVLSRARKIIFVHGCFWHGHAGCKRATIPQRNRKLWIEKIQKNKIRDRNASKRLLKTGWRSLIIWECEIRKPGLARKITAFLESTSSGSRRSGAQAPRSRARSRAGAQ
jgi:DNA mismatch endonuclease, patch repair protein